MLNAKLTVNFIVFYNFGHIHAALDSLQATQTPHVTYVVINGGTETERQVIQASYPNIRILHSETPLSFSQNHNWVMRLADTPYVALLNDDIVLAPDALDKLVEYLDNNPQVGMVGPQLFYEDGRLQSSAYSDPSLIRMIYKISGLASLTHQRSLLRRWLIWLGIGRIIRADSLKTFTEPQTVDVIKGAVMVVRRTAFEQAGLMDETMRHFAEEFDWQWRLRQKGWLVAIVPAAHVTHFGLGQAALQLRGQHLINDRVGILTYFLKHRPRWQVWAIRATMITAHGLWSIVWFPLDRHRAKTHFQIMVKGFRWRYRPADSSL